jgi:hypothetical protein
MPGTGVDGLLGLLPVLTAGYLFNIVFYRTRFVAATAEGQRLFFMCAASGLFIGTLIFPAYHWLIGPRLDSPLAAVLPTAHLGPLMGTLLLAPLIAALLNLGYVARHAFVTDARGDSTWEWLFAKLTLRFGSPLQRLLIRAAERQDLVMLSLHSRKVYCGLIARLPASPRSGDQQYVQIIPKFSATRDKDSLRLADHIDYFPFSLWQAQQRVSSLKRLRSMLERIGVSHELPLRGEVPTVADIQKEISELEELLADVDKNVAPGYLERLRIDDWAKVIPVAQIESASVFDEEAFDGWFANEVSAGP